MTTLDIAHKDRAHSPVGGSSAKRVMNCPGSVRLSALYPNRESSYAAEGTALHEAIDLILQGKTKKDEDVIGLTFNGHVITPELFHAAIVPALEMWDDLDKELGGVRYYNEKRVVFPGIDGAFGTVDIVGTAEDRTIIWDWKFGKGVAVTAEENEQLMFYAYAAAHTSPTDVLFERDKPIELFICQPMVRDGKPFTRWTTSWLQLEAFALDLKRAVAQSQEPDAPFAVGEWCRFCNARQNCPEYTGAVHQALTLTDEVLLADFQKWLPLADRMVELGNSITAAAHKYLEDGGEIPGWKLVPKRGTRKWVNPDAAIQYLEGAGLEPDDIWVKDLITPPAAEKVLKKIGIREMPEGLVEKHSSGTTLAPDADRRPAVTSTTEIMSRLTDRLSVKKSNSNQE